MWSRRSGRERPASLPAADLAPTGRLGGHARDAAGHHGPGGAGVPGRLAVQRPAPSGVGLPAGAGPDRPGGGRLPLVERPGRPGGGRAADRGRRVRGSDRHLDPRAARPCPVPLAPTAAVGTGLPPCRAGDGQRPHPKDHPVPVDPGRGAAPGPSAGRRPSARPGGPGRTHRRLPGGPRGPGGPRPGQRPPRQGGGPAPRPLADPIPTPWPLTSAERLSLWQPIPVGVDEDSTQVTVTMPEGNLLLGGEPGAGKSNVLQLLVAVGALDPSVRLTLFDPKLVELAVWQGSAARLVGPNVEEAIEVLKQLIAELDDRYLHLLANRARKVTEGDGLPLHLVGIEELAYFTNGPDRKAAQAFSTLLRDFV